MIYKEKKAPLNQKIIDKVTEVQVKKINEARELKTQDDTIVINVEAIRK